MTSIVHLDNSAEFFSSLGIKQEAIEAVDDEQDPGNEFNIKEEVMSDTEGVEGLCYQAGSEWSQAQIHTNPDYGDDKILFCSHCAYRTKRRSHFNDHIRSHTGDKPYHCSYCDYKSGLKGNLKRHVVRIHDNPSFDTDKQLLLQCAHCNYACPTKNLLIRHVKMHIVKGETYNLRQGTPKNYAETSPEEKYPYSAKQPEFIDIHLLNVDHYDKLTASHEDALIKQEINNPCQSLLKCPECKYTCVRKTHLNDHLKTHSGEKPFVCILCNYRTGHKSHLTRHMKVHVKKEGNVVLNIPLPLPPPQPVRVKKQVYHCLLCGYKSQVKHCFAKHMRLHLGVALFTCNICNFNAKSSAEIKQHIKIHDRQSEFRCSSCAFKTKSKGRLRRHIAIHRDDI